MSGDKIPSSSGIYVAAIAGLRVYVPTQLWAYGRRVLVKG